MSASKLSKWQESQPDRAASAIPPKKVSICLTSQRMLVFSISGMKEEIGNQRGENEPLDPFHKVYFFNFCPLNASRENKGEDAHGLSAVIESKMEGNR